MLQLREVEIVAKNGLKNTANFCENGNNHGKDTASNHGPEEQYKVYKTQYLALMTFWQKNTAFWQNHGIHGICFP